MWCVTDIVEHTQRRCLDASQEMILIGTIEDTVLVTQKTNVGHRIADSAVKGGSIRPSITDFHTPPAVSCFHGPLGR